MYYNLCVESAAAVDCISFINLFQNSHLALAYNLNHENFKSLDTILEARSHTNNCEINKKFYLV